MRERFNIKAPRRIAAVVSIIHRFARSSGTPSRQVIVYIPDRHTHSSAPMLLLLATLLGLCSAIEDVTFIGTQITCPCKLGCGFCRTRSVEVFEFQTDLASNTTTEPVSLGVIMSGAKEDILRAVRVFRLGPDYTVYAMRQTLHENPKGLWPSSDAATLHVLPRNSSAAQAVVLKATSGATLPGFYGFEMVGGAMYGIGYSGEVCSIKLDGTVACLGHMFSDGTTKAIWATTAVDATAGVMYAIANPRPDDGDGTGCGNTHGHLDCPVLLYSFDLNSSSGAPASAPWQYCFNAANTVLTCNGTNVQSFYHAGPPGQFVALARAYTDPVMVEARLGTPPSLVPLWRGDTSGDIWELVDDGSYDGGGSSMLAPANPNAFDAANNVLWSHMRVGVHHRLVGTTLPNDPSSSSAPSVRVVDVQKSAQGIRDLMVGPSGKR